MIMHSQLASSACWTQN